MARRTRNPSREPPHALRRIREARGISRAELGRRAGFSESHVVKLERGEARLHVDDLAAFASALDCAPADLVSVGVVPPQPTVHAPVVDLTELDEIDDVVRRCPHGTVPVPGSVRHVVAVPLLDASMDRVAPLGSFAVFDRDDCGLEDGEAYLVRTAGDRWLCRRWVARNRHLEPDSTERAHKSIAAETEPVVAGRLVAVIRRV